MADNDSVPIRINLKLPQYVFQLQEQDLSSLHEEAKKSLWEGIEKDEMAPYAKTLPSFLQPPSSDLIAKLEAKNEEELKKFDEKIKAAEESLGETDPSESMREKAGYLCQIGDKERALPAIDAAFEKTAGIGARIDLVLAKIRLAMFYNEKSRVEADVKAAQELIEKGGDWDRRNRLKVYRALHFLSIRNFKEAADLLIDSLSTFTASELMEYDEFVELTVLAAGIGCDRAAIKTKILGSAEINALMPQMPVLTTLIKSLYDTKYAELFASLAEVEQHYLMPNPILAPHARYYVREMRVKAYTQILESYQSLTMERMSKAFGVSPSFIDADLSKFIANRRVSCVIDKVSGVITKTSGAQRNDKYSLYEQVLNAGDALLNDVEKLSRVVG
ncbi:hypothetical protein QFC21_000632 [Naganishia friedmannii]|uniref:Uncharacterized protein n=1 Tax=Naganishia friedmannii TaxID=89922 RepID=A0ACC2WCV4_9TREE|nr:hypothetical protein QFC21_000632 [Naganishia friedmannii]